MLTKLDKRINHGNNKEIPTRIKSIFTAVLPNTSDRQMDVDQLNKRPN